MLSERELRRIVVGPEELWPGLEERILHDEIHPGPHPSERDFLARFDPLRDTRRPRSSSED